MTKKLDEHPCFNASAHHSSERVHLPVAPRCNVQCNFCNRKFDCSNESRPGVTSRVLTPHQSLNYYREIKKRSENLKVVGIAGPGDPFANPVETMETLRLIKDEDSDVMLCVATNGMDLLPHVEELARLQVSHVTITMNGIDPDIIKNVYAWGRHHKKVYRGRALGELLLKNQLEAITALKSNGIIVKINSIMIPGVNDQHLEDIAEVVKSHGADLMNVMAMIPVEGTPFGVLEEPDSKVVTAARFGCSKHLRQMAHCARCRADAVGRIGDGVADAYAQLLEKEFSNPAEAESRPYVAVASQEGALVNLHLGETERLLIYKPSEADPQDYEMVDVRVTPPTGQGQDRWKQMTEMLSDCRAILVHAAGPSPKKVLQDSGCNVVEMDGMIMEGLECIFQNKPLPKKIQNNFKGCQTSCQGNGAGCA